MRSKRSITLRVTLIFSLMVSLTALSARLRADTQTTGTCGGASITIPFTDVASSNIFFCAIAQAFFTGLTNGTTPTTYSPGDFVTREQMAAFITRTLDQSLRRGSLRAALGQWHTPKSFPNPVRTPVGDSPQGVVSDGQDVWVANETAGTVSRVRAGDGRPLETWIGIPGARALLVARGQIFVVTNTSPGRLYRIEPRIPPLAASLVTGSLDDQPHGITTDGDALWIANFGGSIQKVDPDTGAITTFTTGFVQPFGILYDGANLWVTDQGGDDRLKKFDLNSGAITQTINVGTNPRYPAFDGTNLWVPSLSSDSVTVVRAATGQVLATLTGSGMNGPYHAAFDGERILVTSFFNHRVALWKAADLSPLGFVETGGVTTPTGACSDGINFWVAFSTTDQLARF